MIPLVFYRAQKHMNNHIKVIRNTSKENQLKITYKQFTNSQQETYVWHYQQSNKYLKNIAKQIRLAQDLVKLGQYGGLTHK